MKLLIIFFNLFLNLAVFAADCKPLKNSHLFTKDVTESSDRITDLPGFGCVIDIELAGLLPIGNAYSTKAAKLFYWFVESRSHHATAPIVLWLNGGPGAASTYGFFMENGPYRVTDKGTLIKRQASWSDKANYLIIDQPAGVGLSSGKRGTFSDESEAMDQLYQALLTFYKRYPELKSRPLYLSGESYAGKYLPQLAMRILSGNPKDTINLQGLLIGDGWVNPKLQQSSDAEFAYSHGLIDKITYRKVTALYQQCAKEIDKQTPSSRRANTICNNIQLLIKKQSGGLNLANLHTGEEPNDSFMINYLNQSDVRKALHLSPNTPLFKTFSSMVSDVLEIGEQDSMADLYPALLQKNIRILIYNGLDDAKDSNFIGTDKWLAAMTWPHQKAFANAPTCVWRLNNKVVGYAKTSSGLTQIKIRHTGHLAPADQPEVLINLLNKFITNQLFCEIPK